MKLIHLLLLLGYMFGYIRAADYGPCCSGLGQPVLIKKDECWNPITNETSPTVLGDCTILRASTYTVEGDAITITYSNNATQEFSSPFCVANVTNIKDVTLKSTKVKALICLTVEKDYWLAYSSIVSAIFLAITTVIYIALPELRDAQGKSIINFCTALTLAQMFWAPMAIMNYDSMELCATIGFLVYFFLMATFFWTNAISIQILLNTRRPVSFDQGWSEFKWYMIYAWGSPIILTIVMAIVNFHPGDHAKPGIGLDHCWFNNFQQQWIFMFSFMTLLLLINIGIFVYTSLLIWRSSFVSANVRALKYKFLLNARLIFLMGLPWVLDMISSIIAITSKKNILLVIIDLLVMLQGFFIFLLLVVFRRRVVRVMHKHHWLDCIAGPVERWIAANDDEEEVVQHTEVPMSDTNDVR